MRPPKKYRRRVKRALRSDMATAGGYAYCGTRSLGLALSLGFKGFDSSGNHITRFVSTT